MVLAVGDTCKAGLHTIRSEDDLSFNRMGKNGVYHYTCRECKKASDIAYRERLKKNGIQTARLPRIKSVKAFLDRGQCDRGHEILSEDDIVTRNTGRNPPKKYYRCKKCVEHNKVSGSHQKETRRFIVFDKCKHERVFSPPLPWPTEWVLCVKCSDYRQVLRWGNAIGND